MPTSTARKGGPKTFKDIVIPFGQSKGLPLDRADDGLLIWWYDKLYMEYWGAYDELRRRGRLPGARVPPAGVPLPAAAPHPATNPDIVADIRRLFRTWLGRMTMRHHPDRTDPATGRKGSQEAQAVVNEGHALLIQLLDELVKEATGP